MSNISQIVIKAKIDKDIQDKMNRDREILGIVEILRTNTDNIVKDALEATVQDISLSDEETDLKKQLIAPELWMSEVSGDCQQILSYIIWALLNSDKLALDQILDQLNLFNLESKYLELGIPIRFISKAIKEVHTLSTSLINNSDIIEDLDGYFKYMLDVYFKHMIAMLDLQDHSALLDKQHQSLTKLQQEWLAGDADEQTETWNYLREALNPNSPSYSPVSI